MLPADSVWGASCALVSMTTVQFIQFWRPRVGGGVAWAGIAGVSMVRAARAGRMKHLQAGCLQPACTGSRSVTRGMPGRAESGVTMVVAGLLWAAVALLAVTMGSSGSDGIPL